MKAILDHIGIAVRDIDAALAFYRDALGLEVEASEDVRSQRVRAHFVPVGESSLELLEATASDSPIARYLEKRGPGLHHITLRVDDLSAALEHLKTHGVRLIDEHPRPGAEGALVAFVHPASAHGVLVELKQKRESRNADAVTRYTLGDLELISLHDEYFRLDGGAAFGVVPKSQWAAKAAPDERNRITLAIRPLLVRGVRTMLIDAGIGDKEDAVFQDKFGVDRAGNLDRSLAEAGLTPEDIDIVLATHLHFDHAGGFTLRDSAGRIRPRFPRARYVVRRGEWEDATHPHERNRVNYLAHDFLPLAEAGVLEMVDDDQTIMPGVRVRRTGGPTMHHQVVWVESRGQCAAFAGDLVPTAAHLSLTWGMGIDLYPVDTLTAKKAFLKEAEDRHALVFFVHDPKVAAAYIRYQDGKPQMAEHSLMSTQIGIIGGSGLYDMAELTDREEQTLTTPFGDPSGPYVIGTLRGQRVAFLARHGVGHRILPSELNFRANIYGFKVLGVERILSASAVGSLKEEYRPLDIVVPDQFFDRTKGRISTFFGRGLVAHIAFAHPVCGALSTVAADAAESVGAKVHRGGTYVNMEGPQFSTLAESRLYRAWGMDVIGMTNLQEAKLAREAEICYATLALVTDYDCWHPDHDSVTVDLIIANLMQNASTAQKTIADAVSRLAVPRTCACKDALATAIITRPEYVPAQTKKDLEPIIGRYMK